MTKRKNTRKAKKKVQALDLRKVNPQGRLDVLVLNAIEHFTQRVPELRPIVDEKREVIYASLNHNLGPHVIGFDLAGFIDAAQPYLPLLGRIAQSVISNYQQKKVDSPDESKSENTSGVAA